MEHYKIELEAGHEANLRKLANYLLSGTLMADFDMNVFHQRTSIQEREEFEAMKEECLYRSDFYAGDEWHTCGAVGCAVGHGPYAGINKMSDEDWFEYAARAFGSKSLASPASKPISVFEWCFDEDWALVDNTAEGAGKRILYMLAHGIPKNIMEQRDGDQSLSYQNYNPKV